MTYYKFLLDQGVPKYGTGKWSLPTTTEPGAWMPIVKEIKLCASGYHFCANESQLRQWIAPKCYEIEVRGNVLHDNEKSVAQEARLIREYTNWNEHAMRLFACDCAERVLHIYEAKYPSDKRVRNCIEGARDYANGKIPIEKIRELRAAAVTAYAATAYAAAAAAGAAAHAAYAAHAAHTVYAAHTAYAAAAYAADADATYADAADVRQKEKDWQNQRILQYLNGEIV